MSGFLAFVLVLIIVGTPVAWEVFAGFVIGTPVAAAVCAHRLRVGRLESLGYTFALVLLSWPVLAFMGLIVRYWVTGKAFGN